MDLGPGLFPNRQAVLVAASAAFEDRLTARVEHVDHQRVTLATGNICRRHQVDYSVLHDYSTRVGHRFGEGLNGEPGVGLGVVGFAQLRLRCLPRHACQSEDEPVSNQSKGGAIPCSLHLFSLIHAHVCIDHETIRQRNEIGRAVAASHNEDAGVLRLGRCRTVRDETLLAAPPTELFLQEALAAKVKEVDICGVWL